MKEVTANSCSVWYVNVWHSTNGYFYLLCLMVWIHLLAATLNKYFSNMTLNHALDSSL